MAKKVVKKEQRKSGVAQTLLKPFPFKKEEFKTVFVVHNRIRNAVSMK